MLMLIVLCAMLSGVSGMIWFCNSTSGSSCEKRLLVSSCSWCAACPHYNLLAACTIALVHTVSINNFRTSPKGCVNSNSAFCPGLYQTGFLAASSSSVPASLCKAPSFTHSLTQAPARSAWHCQSPSVQDGDAVTHILTCTATLHSSLQGQVSQYRCRRSVSGMC